MADKFQDLLESLGCQLLLKEEFPARPASYRNVPEALDDRVKAFVRKQFPSSLYSHQVEAIEAVLAGQHVGITTSTASGKSAAFVLPILDTLMQTKNTRALYISPVKALGNDQRRKFEQWKLSAVVARYDGDVSPAEREEAIKRKRLLIATPDVLHATLLRRNKEQYYNGFFGGLTHIVLDECHIYSGAFGSHVAMVIRRLRQICRNHGSKPCFFLASATVGNAAAHFEDLTGLAGIKVIDDERNGSPVHEKTFWFVKRPEGKLNSIFINELLGRLLELDQKFIVFCDTRREVESIISESWSRDPKTQDKVMPYRAGYEAGDRAIIEKALSTGDLKGVISTSALEMGIDIPDLDICVMVGMPSSKTSMVQRMGRAGRSRPGTILLVAGDGPNDNYFCRYPDKVLSRPLEDLTINTGNRVIMLSHFACARAEATSFQSPRLDTDIFNQDFLQLASQVNEFECTEDILYDQYPHYQVSIRAIDDPSFEIKEDMNHGSDNPSIGTINYSQILREAYPRAIYGHRGRKYRVERVSHAAKEVLVRPQTFTKVQTIPRKELLVRERATRYEISRLWPGMSVHYGSLGIVEKVSGYVEKGVRGKQEVTYEQPLMRYFPTSGLVIHLDGLANISHGAVMGVCAALEVCYPIFARCAHEDIGVYGWSKEGNSAKIYLYDNVAGGLGITRQAADNFRELIAMVHDHVADCSCQSSEESPHGCIYCVLGNPWLNYPKQNTRHDSIRLLNELTVTTAKDELLHAKPPEVSVSKAKNGKTFGLKMIAAGSSVYTASRAEGEVVDSKPIQNKMFCDRQYTVRIGDQVKQLLGQSLALIHGRLELWCINCGAEYIGLTEKQCPQCGVQLL
ncbi:MAG: DEAD/DEAH box helicase [Sporomusaceae bacterium]|nr:DEAD/DEAH box helicase [Sporomusaceae bacterium]